MNQKRSRNSLDIYCECRNKDVQTKYSHKYRKDGKTKNTINIMEEICIITRTKKEH